MRQIKELREGKKGGRKEARKKEGREEEGRKESMRHIKEFLSSLVTIVHQMFS